MNNQKQQWYLNNTATMESMKLWIKKLSSTDSLFARVYNMNDASSQSFLYAHEDALKVGKFNELYGHGCIQSFEIPFEGKMLRRFAHEAFVHFFDVASRIEKIVDEAVHSMDYGHDYLKWLMKEIPMLHAGHLVNTFGLLLSDNLHISSTIGEKWTADRALNVKRAIAIEIVNITQVIKHIRYFGTERLNEDLNSNSYYTQGLTRAWFQRLVPALRLLEDVEVLYAD